MRHSEDAKLKLAHKQKEIQEWQELFGHPSWVRLLEWMEEQYTQVSADDYTSLRKLAALQERRKFIRSMFDFIRYEFSEVEVLRREYQQFKADEDEIPSREIFL